MKKPLIFCLVFILAGLATSTPKRSEVLREGFVFSGVDGKLIIGDGEKWFFKTDSDISDDQGTIEAGTEIELLASSALEKVTSGFKKGSESTYRIWGKIAAYNGKNFIFSFYFLPFTEVRQSQTSPVGEKQKAEIINDPNDELSVPDDLVEKLSARKIIRTEELKKGLEIKADSILADRTGFLSWDDNGDVAFVLDGLGRNVPRISIKLLPCYFLQLAEHKQAYALEKLRFKVAGVVTRYKGENYLLLHRIRRVHSHGNFAQ